MKKLAVLAALTIMSLSVFAQKAVVNLNNWDVDKPIFFKSQGGAIPAGTTVYAELLGGTVGGTLAPVVPTSGGSSVITVDPDGHFDAGVGVVPGLTAAGPADFQLRAWTGATTYSAATPDNQAITPVFAGTVNAWNDTAVPQPLPIGTTLNLPAANLVIGSGSPVIPEPSTIALGLLGAGALLIRRRK